MLKDMFFSKPNGGLFPGEAASEEPVAKGQPSTSAGTPLGSTTEKPTEIYRVFSLNN